LNDQKSGTRRSFWLPHDVDIKAEKIRKTLGLGRSAFYRFAIIDIEVIKGFAQDKIATKEGEP
jgi:hypothetical protein